MTVGLRDELQERENQVGILQQLLGECCMEMGNHCSWRDLPGRIKKIKEALEEIRDLCLLELGENDEE